MKDFVFRDPSDERASVTIQAENAETADILIAKYLARWEEDPTVLQLVRPISLEPKGIEAKTAASFN